MGVSVSEDSNPLRGLGLASLVRRRGRFGIGVSDTKRGTPDGGASFGAPGQSKSEPVIKVAWGGLGRGLVIPSQEFERSGSSPAEGWPPERGHPFGCPLSGAGDRTRTGTRLPARDFKSLVSTIPPHRPVDSHNVSSWKDGVKKGVPQKTALPFLHELFSLPQQRRLPLQ